VNISKLRSLNASEWWLLLTTAMLIPAYSVAVRSGLYKPSRWPLGVVRHEGRPLSRETARRLGALVNTAARYSPWRPSCLVRSLVLVEQLRRRNMPSNLCIGVRLSDGQLMAHAWVEQHGVPVNDSVDIANEFSPIDTELGCLALAHS